MCHSCSLSSVRLSDTQEAVPEVKVWAAVEPFCCWLFFTLVINLFREEVCFFRVWTMSLTKSQSQLSGCVSSSPQPGQISLNYNFLLTDTMSALFVWHFLRQTTGINPVLHSRPHYVRSRNQRVCQVFIEVEVFFPFLRNKLARRIKKKW